MSRISDEELERMLSEPAEKLPDDGFTQSVLMQLPPRVERKSKRRAVLLGFAGAAGMVPVGLALANPEALMLVLSGVAAVGVAAVVAWSVLTATELV